MSDLTVRLTVCNEEHGGEGNPARVYGHHGSPRTCIRVKATDRWVYDPDWERRDRPPRMMPFQPPPPPYQPYA